jgi:hypothetical protein
MVGIRKETAVVYFNTLSQQLSGQREEDHGNHQSG